MKDLGSFLCACNTSKCIKWSHISVHYYLYISLSVLWTEICFMVVSAHSQSVQAVAPLLLSAIKILAVRGVQWRRHNYAPQPDTKDPTPPTDLPFLHRAVKLYHTGHGTGDHRDHLGRFRCAPNDSVIILETHGMFFRFWMCGLSCFSWPRATIHKRARVGWGGGDSTVNFFFFFLLCILMGIGQLFCSCCVNRSTRGP